MNDRIESIFVVHCLLSWSASLPESRIRFRVVLAGIENHSGSLFQIPNGCEGMENHQFLPDFSRQTCYELLYL